MTIRPASDPNGNIPFVSETIRTSRVTLRLAVVTETYPPEINGVASTLARFVEGLSERGHLVELLRPRQSRDFASASHGISATSGPPRDYAEILFKGVAVPRYPNLRMGLPARRALLKRWSMQRPDLVHIATEGPLGWSALQAARKLRLPVSSDFRTNFDAYSAHYGIGWLRQPIAAYLRRFHNHTQVTMVPTQAMRVRLSALGFENLEVVARGVDTQLFSPARRSDALRQTWGVQPDAPVVLHVGRLAPEKNLPALGLAFDAIRQRRPDAKLVLVGDGPLRSRLQWQYPDAIFAGMRCGDDLAAHYASADVFVFPSMTETFGNVTLEAMASGLAIATYRYAAAAEHLEHGVNALLAPFDDAKALVAQAVALVAEPARARCLGAHARCAAEQLGWPRLVDQLEAVMRRTVATAEDDPVSGILRTPDRAKSGPHSTATRLKHPRARPSVP